MGLQGNVQQPAEEKKSADGPNWRKGKFHDSEFTSQPAQPQGVNLVQNMQPLKEGGGGKKRKKKKGQIQVMGKPED